MDGLRFVLEAPQLSQTHKKRPRLVTSCDNWCVLLPHLELVLEIAHPSLFFCYLSPTPSSQPSEENQVCPGQVPTPLRSLRGWQNSLSVP